MDPRAGLRRFESRAMGSPLRLTLSVGTHDRAPVEGEGDRAWQAVVDEFEAAEEVLSRFEEVGLINDSAFADAWVESRHHGRGLARRALAQELRTKGVDSTLIDAAVSQLDSEQEEATARELVARKLRSTRGLDREKRLRRLAGMLARKGYSEGMALRVVRQALEEEGEDTEILGDEGF